jgi:hypothetical protein
MTDEDHATRAIATDLRRWLAAGKQMQATHVVVKTDTFSSEDYAIYVYADEDARTIAETNEAMEKTKEVYDLSKDFEAQMNEDRAWNV